MDAPEAGMDEAREDVWEGPGEPQGRAEDGPAMDLRRAATRLRVVAGLLFLGSAWFALQFLMALGQLLVGLGGGAAFQGLQAVQSLLLAAWSLGAGLAALRFAGTCTPEGAARGLAPHLEAAGRWWTLVAVGFTLWLVSQLSGTVMLLTLGVESFLPPQDGLGAPGGPGTPLDELRVPVAALSAAVLAPAALQAARALRWGAWMAGLVAAGIAISPLGLHFAFRDVVDELAVDLPFGFWAAMGAVALVYVLAWCLWLVWVVWRLREHGDQVERLATTPDGAHTAAYTRGLVRAIHALLGGLAVMGGLVMLVVLGSIGAGVYLTMYAL